MPWLQVSVLRQWKTGEFDISVAIGAGQEDIELTVAPELKSLLVSRAFEHWSDCAVYNEPADRTGDCDCGAYRRDADA